MPERSCGLNAWPSTLNFTFESALSLLFWHRGHCFHPSGEGIEAGLWAIPAIEKTSAATKTLIETNTCFCIGFCLSHKFDSGSHPNCRWERMCSALGNFAHEVGGVFCAAAALVYGQHDRRRCRRPRRLKRTCHD